MTNDRRPVDVELLQRTLDHITSNPREHDQESWGYRSPCGTSFCLAGHAVRLSDRYDLTWVDEGDGNFYLAGAAYARPGGNGERVDVSERRLSRLDGFRSVASAADDVLGLEGSHYHLFGASLTLHQLWYRADQATDGRLDVPAEFDGRPADEDDSYDD